ncbi:MAG: hypothetical protein H7223_02815, partial [Pedobacter sp.]|nr:hypothetical protein [Pedobacter sp.]
ENTLPDYRSTIYWNANLKTYSTGKTSFSYFNADGPGNYKVVVEGINAEGELGRQVFRYTVEAAEGPLFQPLASKFESNMITTALDTLNKLLPVEKVYLHTDKPYYLVGDTVWFKAYVTSGSNNLPSSLSGTLYIDLISDADSVAQTRKLKLTAGTANSEFVLDDSTTLEGNYRIRAYTQWMRNAGPDYFYDRMFSVGNAVTNNVFSKMSYTYKESGTDRKTNALLKYTDEKGAPFSEKEVNYQLKEGFKIIVSGSGKTNSLGELLLDLPKNKHEDLKSAHLTTLISISKDQVVPKTFPIKASVQQPDVQFFPEGGTLLNGLRTKVAFKVTGTDGLGMTINGIVVDSDGNLTEKIETEHLGMGLFMLTPKPGKTYTAKVKFGDSTERSYAIPEASDSGYSLAVSPRGKDSIVVTVNAGKSTFKPGQKLQIVGQSNQTGRFMKDLKMDKPSSTVFFPIKDYPSGLMQITLFNQDSQPLNERLVFLQNRDTLALNVFEVKSIYRQKEKVDFQLESRESSSNGVTANLSISVVNEVSVPFRAERENSIFAQLLLLSDLKGYVEKPNYYFSNISDSTKSSLDLLMLTQGYRRFTWKEVIVGNIKPPAFKIEKINRSISGILTTLTNKPLPDGKVTLFNNKNGAILTTVTNTEGKFSFGNLAVLKGTKFTIQGRTSSGGNKLITVVDEIGQQDLTDNVNLGDINNDIPELLRSSLAAAKVQDLELEKNGKMSKAMQLREVQIKTVKAWGFGNKINDSQADQVFKPDARRPCATLMECLLEMDKNSSVSFRQQLDDSEQKCGLLNIFVSKQGEEYAVLIDDMPMGPCDYQNLLLGTPMSVDKILFSNQSAAISARLLTGYLSKFKGNRSLAVLAIYTKNGNFRANYDPSIAVYTPKAYDISKEFYVPKYDFVGDSPIADLRSTVYWNPSVITGANGRTPLSFFNNDRLGIYRVTIEGIGKNGFLGRKVFRYEVVSEALK